MCVYDGNVNKYQGMNRLGVASGEILNQIKLMFKNSFSFQLLTPHPIYETFYLKTEMTQTLVYIIEFWETQSFPSQNFPITLKN